MIQFFSRRSKWQSTDYKSAHFKVKYVTKNFLFITVCVKNTHSVLHSFYSSMIHYELAILENFEEIAGLWFYFDNVIFLNLSEIGENVQKTSNNE